MSAPGVDGVELAVLSNRVEGAVLSMMNTLLRTSRSGVINNGRDFSCCVLTAGDELLAMAESQPIHVLAGPDLMAKSMKEFHPALARGQAFLHNSPYHGNSHAADHSVLIPVIDDDGVHRFTVLAKAHQADCGNAPPTTYVADARDVYEEGALIFPCVQVQEGYRDIEDVIRLSRRSTSSMAASGSTVTRIRSGIPSGTPGNGSCAVSTTISPAGSRRIAPTMRSSA